VDGILLIDKPQAWTSFQAIARVRKVFQTRETGHCGTLDPLATGLLIVGVGKATKLLSYYNILKKTYIAQGRLGLISNTFDREGELTKTQENVALVTLPEWERALRLFRGEIEQQPPLFSAVRLNGKRAYNLARNGVNFSLPMRPVTIYELELENYVHPDFTIRIKCTSGTYIRSLVHDIGQVLGTGAVMTDLVRIAIGSYELSQAQPLLQINPQVVIPPHEGVNFLPEVALSPDVALEHGAPFQEKDILSVEKSSIDYYRITKKKSDEIILAIVKRKKIDYNNNIQPWEYCRVIRYLTRDSVWVS